MTVTKDDKPILTKDGKPLNVPWSLVIGIAALVLGLGSQLWGIAIVGGIFLGYWLLKRYPPRTAGVAPAVGDVRETPIAPQATLVVAQDPEPRSNDTVLGLRELADLHERGALTDEEFASAKARLLANIT